MAEPGQLFGRIAQLSSEGASASAGHQRLVIRGSTLLLLAVVSGIFRGRENRQATEPQVVCAMNP